MRGSFQLGLAIAGLALTLPANASSARRQVEGRIAIVQSDRHASRLDRYRLITILERACAELHLDGSSFPRIVFIRLSRDEASAGGVPAGAPVLVERAFLTVEGKDKTEAARFLVWIVNEPSDEKLVAAVVRALCLHFGLRLSEADRLSAEQRIVRRSSATVDVNSFVK